MRFLIPLLFIIGVCYGFLDLPLPDIVPDKLTPDIIDRAFSKFESLFHKAYKDAEERKKALKEFGENLRTVLRLNIENAIGKVKYGINEFSDLSDKEFGERIANLPPPDDREKLFSSAPHPIRPNRYNDVPKSFDWRSKKNTVGPVANQGDCGCCWAFSSGGIIQSAYAIKNGEIVIPSYQQLCECSQKNNPGCNGGHAYYGLNYSINTGVSLEKSYATYDAQRAKEVGTCEDSDSENKLKIEKYWSVNNEQDKISTIANNAPITLQYKVGQSFRHYKSGVFSSTDCDNDDTFVGRHEVLTVGYGEEDGKKYWLIRNSWGKSWGDEGYVKIERGVDLCEIDNLPSYTAVY